MVLPSSVHVDCFSICQLSKSCPFDNSTADSVSEQIVHFLMRFPFFVQVALSLISQFANWCVCPSSASLAIVFVSVSEQPLFVHFLCALPFSVFVGSFVVFHSPKLCPIGEIFVKSILESQFKQ